MSSTARAIDVAILRCAACGALDPGPRALCPRCQRPLEPASVPATGTLVSWTMIRRPPASFKADGAYAVAVVRLDAGVQVTGRLASPGEGAKPGARVTAHARLRDIAMFEVDG